MGRRCPFMDPKPCPVVLVGCRVLNKISFILCPILTSYAQPDLHSNPPDWLSRTCPFTDPRVAAGPWNLVWKAPLRGLCFPWLFLWKFWEWWLVDQWEYGDFHWPLSLGLLGKPAKENFSFLLYLVSQSTSLGERERVHVNEERWEAFSKTNLQRINSFLLLCWESQTKMILFSAHDKTLNNWDGKSSPRSILLCKGLCYYCSHARFELLLRKSLQPKLCIWLA